MGAAAARANRGSRRLSVAGRWSLVTGVCARRSPRCAEMDAPVAEITDSRGLFERPWRWTAISSVASGSACGLRRLRARIALAGAGGARGRALAQAARSDCAALCHWQYRDDIGDYRRRSATTGAPDEPASGMADPMSPEPVTRPGRTGSSPAVPGLVPGSRRPVHDAGGADRGHPALGHIAGRASPGFIPPCSAPVSSKLLALRLAGAARREPRRRSGLPTARRRLRAPAGRDVQRRAARGRRGADQISSNWAWCCARLPGTKVIQCMQHDPIEPALWITSRISRATIAYANDLDDLACISISAYDG